MTATRVVRVLRWGGLVSVEVEADGEVYVFAHGEGEDVHLRTLEGDYFALHRIFSTCDVALWQVGSAHAGLIAFKPDGLPSHRRMSSVLVESQHHTLWIPASAGVTAGQRQPLRPLLRVPDRTRNVLRFQFAGAVSTYSSIHDRHMGCSRSAAAAWSPYR